MMPRGSSLATVLVLSALLMTLAWVVCALGYQHLSFVNRCDQVQRAQNLADSVVSLGLARILEKPDFQGSLTIDLGDGGQADLQFGTTGAFSTNNLGGDNAVPGWGDRVVPRNAVLLVGTGRCRSVTRQVEALFYVPPYPYSIACEGSFHCTGPLLVGTVHELGSDELLPGHLLSNASAANAVRTESTTRITGNLVSCGGAELSADTQVLGEKRLYGAHSELPELKVGDYDPLRLGKVTQQAPGYLVHPSLSGFVRRTGDLHIRDGLELDGASLYVEGNLFVEGGVRGRGALFVTGNTRLLGGSALSTDNQAALVCSGNVEVSGDGQRSSYFQGLMYVGGNLSATRMTLLGPLVSRGKDGVEISDAALLNYPPYGQLALQETWTTFSFLSSNGRFKGTQKSTSGNRTFLEVSRGADGTFRVRDPGSGQLSEDLTLPMALSKIRELVPMRAAQDEDHGEDHGDAHDEADLQAALLALSQSTPAGEPSQAPAVDVDLNRVLPLAEKLRQLYWRTL